MYFRYNWVYVYVIFCKCEINEDICLVKIENNFKIDWKKWVSNWILS